MSQPKPLLRSVVPDRMTPLVQELGEPSYRARQLVEWVHGHGVLQWERMTNLPVGLRDRLAERYDLAALETTERLVSNDGTRKFLFRLRDGNSVESVIIPMADHPTFCISSQVGCAMACRFCATARGGLVRNLDAGEIVEQVVRLRDDLAEEPLPGDGGKQFNIVYMGMGEPLDNWNQVAASVNLLTDPQGWNISRRRIQISTSGPREGLEKLLAAAPGVGLTLSLGGSDDQERKQVMPVPGRTPLADAVRLAADYGRKAGRRVTLAWVLIAGRTDDPQQARRLAALARTGPFKINLIPMNPLDDSADRAPEREAILRFQKILTDAGLVTFLRSSGGSDIAAACGQLHRRVEKKQGRNNT